MTDVVISADESSSAGSATSSSRVDWSDGAGNLPLRRWRWGWAVWASVAWLSVLGIVLVALPVLPVDDPDAVSADLFAGPGEHGHLFGTDEIGRDLFARVLWGGRISLSIGVASLVLGFVLGGALGATAGFFRGRYEKLVVGVVDVMVAFPSLVLAMALLRMLSEPGSLDGSFGKIVLVLSVLAVPAIARITRANTLVYSQREFVTAAACVGAGPLRILRREVLPNVLPAMVSFSFLALAVLVVAEGALAFLGLSVQAPTATWGKLIELGRRDLDRAPHLTFIPCGFLFLTLLSLNIIGDKLQARFATSDAKL